ncbi:MAG: type VI secretion system baseplate subunit TssG [Planctomycetota bacterium]
MAHQDRSASLALTLRLLERPHAFDFFQLVRRIDAAMGKGGPGIGASARPAQDPVRFGQAPSMTFESSAVSGFEPGNNAKPPRVNVAFMGLLGANGPLPHHVTEYARDRERDARDDTIRRFFDVFQHRAVSLFYRAWAVNRPTAQRDRVARDGEAADRFGYYVASIAGLASDSVRGRDAVPDHAKWHFAGRLANQTRPPESIAAIVEDDFGIACEVEEFVGTWMDLPKDARLELGGASENTGLGISAIVGERYWDCQQKFRLRLGPMRRDDYEQFLPGARGFARLTAWVRQHVGFELVWEAKLVLDKRDATGTRLGRPDDGLDSASAVAGAGARLGWTSWLMSTPLETDPDQLTLRGPETPDPSQHL